MVRQIDHDQVRDLVQSRDAQLVEVLPAQQYSWAHLPAARNLSLKELASPDTGILDRARPVIVYCNDSL